MEVTTDLTHVQVSFFNNLDESVCVLILSYKQAVVPYSPFIPYTQEQKSTTNFSFEIRRSSFCERIHIVYKLSDLQNTLQKLKE